MRTAGVASVGIILDMSGSVPLDELKQVMVAIADLPSPSISGIALTDVAVQHAGSREEILQLILSSKFFGGGTDFSKIADDAWKKIGCPPYLALISDGETVAWPARFPVPTTLFMIDRSGLYGNSLQSRGYNVPACSATTNVQEILTLDLPRLQDLSRGLD